MPSYNHVVLVGNLTRDPELRYTPGGTAVCDFTVAVNEKWTSKDGEKKESVSFIDCTVWQKDAEIFAKYMKKGRPVLVDGKLKQETWTDEKTDQKRSRIKVQVQNFQFLGSKDGGGKPSVDEEDGGPPPEDIPF